MSCTCCDSNTYTSEMESRHGTPAEFKAAVFACVEISTAEAEAAVAEYQSVWIKAARRELMPLYSDRR